MTSPNDNATEVIAGLGTIADRYDVLLCDVWGVLHNGVAAFPEAGEALARFRARGGTVVLITNAPRPHGVVRVMLDGLNARSDAYDAIVTSGDVTRGEIAARHGLPVWHLGPARDLPVFEGLDVSLAALEDAAYVVCTGLFDDDTETPDDYADRLRAMAERRLTMVCANPDLVVERGHELIYCAGAIAAAYEAIGGRSIYAGKPHLPIYARAIERAVAVRGAAPDARRVLAIGDALRTDIAGARAAGFDSLFVARGIHAAETLDDRGHIDETRLSSLIAGRQPSPTVAIERLVW
ncbi:HAD superfamily hydrolase (TIGR01459 family) [Pseudochelatococcus lubricantis]|uniref:HAD superfamily hydrolase (TIGR01459 family) n=1 Tax=Pseudochelatococcus lubricantis TaxID=1538102 RepID=A0ABX0UU09_9HYPH|nr:TIGR01459 family HAD-type hydrolase [Pseudochelatococcus lubricantis]NIJ56449.1 HAD superfamily hydrolase (TIGR01459 family) [Pseudochelatococcus lubricantis]